MQSGGDVSPSTKHRNYRNPGLVAARGKVCNCVCPNLHRLLLFLCRFSPTETAKE